MIISGFRKLQKTDTNMAKEFRYTKVVGASMCKISTDVVVFNDDV